MNIWQKCGGESNFTSVSAIAWRFVEAQGTISTRKLVDSLDEQILLEQMIEAVKPPIPKDCIGLHPLLYTPFRYPPLPYGSRFGKKYERSLWYGSEKITTAMAEVAYYRLLMIHGSEANFGIVTIPFTAFSIQIKTTRGIKLTEQPFSAYKETILSPNLYTASQELGSLMRAAETEAIIYESARDPEQGTNVALFSPLSFYNKQPKAQSLQSWTGVIDPTEVDFISTSSIEINAVKFKLEMFLVNNELPVPAF